jgi:hypothetical protein
VETPQWTGVPVITNEQASDILEGMKKHEGGWEKFLGPTVDETISLLHSRIGEANLDMNIALSGGMEAFRERIALSVILVSVNRGVKDGSN